MQLDSADVASYRLSVCTARLSLLVETLEGLTIALPINAWPRFLLEDIVYISRLVAFFVVPVVLFPAVSIVHLYIISWLAMAKAPTRHSQI